MYDIMNYAIYLKNKFRSYKYMYVHCPYIYRGNLKNFIFWKCFDLKQNDSMHHLNIKKCDFFFRRQSLYSFSNNHINVHFVKD